MFKRVICILLLWYSPQQSYATKTLMLQKLQASAELLEYTEVALNLTKRFIAQRTNTLVIMEKCELICQELQPLHKAILQNFLHNLSYSINVQLFFGKPDDRPWDYNLFVVDSWWSFQSLRYRIPVTTLEREFYFFILLTWIIPDYRSLNRQMQLIFEMCLNLSVKNVIIMHRSVQERHISFYTYAFNKEQCQKGITIYEINRYENGQLRRDFLFPHHLNDFHGCSVTVSGHLIAPLLTFNGDFDNEEHLSDKRRVGGIEGEILKVVTETLNLKLKFRFPRDVSGTRIFSNASKTFLDIDDQSAEIAIGGLSPILPNAHKYSFSFVYHTTPSVFVVKEGLRFGPIKRLVKPLNPMTWLIILIQCFIAMVIIAFLEYAGKSTWRNFIIGPRNNYPIHHLFVALLGNPLPTTALPTRNFARFLLMAWLVLTFELRNAYQGKMFDSLRLGKRLPVPATIAELIQRDYILLAPAIDDFYPANKTRITHNTAKILNLLNHSQEPLTAKVLLDYLRNHNNKYGHNSSLTYVNENIYFYQCVMFFKKHSILPGSFDRKLKMLSDAGITAHIAKRHLRWQKRNKNSPSPSSGVAEITNPNLRGLYTICGMLCWIATIVFALELLTKSSKRLKTVMDWLN